MDGQHAPFPVAQMGTYQYYALAAVKIWGQHLGVFDYQSPLQLLLRKGEPFYRLQDNVTKVAITFFGDSTDGFFGKLRESFFKVVGYHPPAVSDNVKQ